MSLHRIFVYGTLKRGEPNHKLLANPENGIATFVGLAKTNDKWPMVIASEFNIPFILHAKGKGKCVFGEIYDVDDSMLKHLDVLEDHPHLYERVQRDVVMVKDKTVDDQNNTIDTNINNNDDLESSESVIKCWIYFFHKYKASMLELPYLDDYSSLGPHGLRYVERYVKDPVMGEGLKQSIQTE